MPNRNQFFRFRRTFHICPPVADICPRAADIFLLYHILADNFFWRTCPRYFWRTTVHRRRIFVHRRRIFVRRGQLSANILRLSRTKFTTEILADFFLADCPRVDGGPDRIRSDPPRTLADFLSPHKVRLGPPESAKRKSSADTGADSSGQWRTQADPIGSAADSGGQLSASFSAENFMQNC